MKGTPMKKALSSTTDSERSTSGSEWLDKFPPEDLSLGAAAPSSQRPPSRSERKAEESTRVAREVTDAATEQRQTTTARLRGARLKWEADARALAAKEPTKKRKNGTTG